jgi:uncharacterized membrane protein
MSMDGWLLVRAAHLVAMAFFVGGQLLLALAVVPAERRSPDRERLRAVARRFGWGSLAAIAVLAATGAAMASHLHQWGESALHLKLALVGAVGLLVVLHMRLPRLHVIEGAIFVLSLAIVWLGVVLAH